MTKLKFILLLLFVLLVALWGIGFGGNPFLLYCDAPSLIITPIVPYIMASFIFPFSLQIRFNKEIFKTEGTPERPLLENALVFFNLLRKLTILGAILGTFIGFIGIMGYLSEMTSLVNVGRNIGVLALCPFYATVFIFAVVEPLKGVVKKKLIG